MRKPQTPRPARPAPSPFQRSLVRPVGQASAVPDTSGGSVPPAGRTEDVERAYRRLVEIAAQDDAERQRGIRLLKVITGDPKKPFVALTFDDGPHGQKTLDLLDLLRKLQVPATFFVVGMQARKYPEIIERMVLEGHEVGNHTYHHYRLP